jgi:threonine synthase
VFVPESTTAGKVAQIRMYGADVVRIPGTREDTAAAALKETENTYYASHYWNPFFLHGTKTFAYEVCEQLNWQPPDAIVLPVGNGSLILGVGIGFAELIQIGAVEEMPRLIAIQAEDCAPLHRAFQTGSKVIPVDSKKGNLAEGIAIADPPRGDQIIALVEQSQGDFLKVSNSEIRQAIQEMASRGFYIEPTSAATVAGLKKYLISASSDEKIVSVFTGHGLKATAKISMLFTD